VGPLDATGEALAQLFGSTVEEATQRLNTRVIPTPGVKCANRRCAPDRSPLNGE
jgi:hypothetical protein